MTTRAGTVGSRGARPARRARVLVAAAIGACALVAGTPVAAQDADPVVVSITDGGFDPKDLRVDAGTEVRWENTGSVVHTVTADDGSFDSGLLAPGQSFTLTFDTAGEFPYSSPVDAPPLFPGTVTVAAPAPAPTTTTPPDDAAAGEPGEEPGAMEPATPSRPSDLADTGPDEPYGWLLVGLGLVLVGVVARTWFRVPALARREAIAGPGRPLRRR